MESGKKRKPIFLVEISGGRAGRGAFLASPEIIQRKQNWPMCYSKDNLLFRDPEFMGSSPSPLQEISVHKKVPGKSSYDSRQKGQFKLVYIKGNAVEHHYVLLLPQRNTI